VTESAPIEFLEVEAWTQRVEALPAELKARLGTRARRFGRAVALATPGADAATVNRAFGLGLDQPLDAALLTEINAFFREAGSPRWLVECAPHATVTGGRDILTSQGGVLKTPTVKLVGQLRDMTGAPRGSVSVEEIGCESSDTFRGIVGPAFGVPEVVEPDIVSAIGHPGWHYYLAFDEGRPIAGAAMFVQNDGVWFGVMATSAESRNRGAQTALLARRVADAKRLGCSWATAETALDTLERPNPSYRNMLRLGLRVAYLRDKYVFENTRA
jgi:GNAT superfamily N-acetyltransferase